MSYRNDTRTRLKVDVGSSVFVGDGRPTSFDNDRLRCDVRDHVAIEGRRGTGRFESHPALPCLWTAISARISAPKVAASNAVISPES